MTLCVCIIAKNEGGVIARVLKCAKKFADKIVVVDTGSTDDTMQIALDYTPEVYTFEWNYNFSAARNFSLEKSDCDYTMWLDCDDIVADESCRKIKNLIAQNPDFDMAFLPYQAAFEEGEPTFVYYRERIFRTEKNYRFSGAVHEAVAPSGKVIYFDAPISHKKEKPSDPLRNLNIYQKRIGAGICLDERDKFYYGRELLFNGMYLESVAVLEEFLRGGGWIENKKEACLNLYSAYTALGRKEEGFCVLLRSFLYGKPTPQACCLLGGKFFEEGDLKTAEFWYRKALECKTDCTAGGFCNRDFERYVPLIQLCVIYDRLGDTVRAEKFNDLAGEAKPHAESYKRNKEYFRNRHGDGFKSS